MNSLKSLYIFGLVLFGVVVVHAGIPGAPQLLEGDQRKEALTLLDVTLAQLASGNGPSYKAINVTSVTRQVVSGALHTYEVELDNGSDKKQCTVEIFSQPWLDKNGTTINIKCSGDDGELNRTW